jgi:hypothetical protein
MFADINYDEPPKIDESKVERIVNCHLSELEKNKQTVVKLLRKNRQFCMHELFGDDLCSWNGSFLVQGKMKEEELWKEVRTRLSKCTGLRVYGEPQFSYDIDTSGDIGSVNLIFMKK